jgi:hypothetical protein
MSTVAEMEVARVGSKSVQRGSSDGPGMHLDAWAQRQAHQHLRSLEKRWVHSQAVARQAERVGRFLEPAEHEVLVAAAYLHDVGYAPSLADSGFHPLDGARGLTGLGHDRLAGLVAHHSGSKHEAALRGLCGELAAFPEERSLVAAALAYCDLTVGPNGERMTPEERLADVEARHGPNSVVAAGLRRGWLELTEAVGLVEERLQAVGFAQPY